jgi:pimeloyl-ACP methyl ester carboxylesterase
MGEGKVKSNGVEIWYQDFGDGSNPTILFVSGASSQGLWPPALINPIVDAGYHVICFDNRDIGLSTWIDDYSAHPYTLNDMADDAVGLMDALNIKQAHVIGASMGGMIAQLIAINHPHRVLSLTSWMSTYLYNDPDLPVVTDKVQALTKELIESPPMTKEAIIDFWVNMFRTLAGSRFPFDEKAFRIYQEAMAARGQNPKNNHSLAVMSSPSRLDALRKLNVPTLVIHGDEDPIINWVHGVVCAKVIPGAKLYIQKGVGHEIPEGIIPETVQVILEHVSRMK